MRLVASDLYRLLSPSACERRVFLDARGIEKTPPGAFEEILFELGERHERRHLDSLGAFVDMREGSEEDRTQRTRDAVLSGVPVVYQGVLRGTAKISGSACEIVGEPDFLLVAGKSYAVRDAKLARRITEQAHREIFLQLGLYGWLFEQTFGLPPVGLEVVDGAGEVHAVPADGGRAALTALARIVAVRATVDEPYSPVGWSKCGGCSYQAICWPAAVARRDLAIVQGVDQGLAIRLREVGILSVEDLVEGFDTQKLEALARPSGSSFRKVGRAAATILRNARVLSKGTEEIFARPAVPHAPNCVMFDLEGLPPYFDELDRIYLWGLRVFGTRPTPYLGVITSTADGADHNAWKGFLETSRRVFSEYGDLPFVHWHVYERTKLRQYLDRYGDTDGIAARVERNLVDLHAILQASIALPLPSLSLKVVEKYIGFERTQTEFGGEWSIAMFIRAVETGDEVERMRLLEVIRRYNEEDLDATWAVLQWLRRKATIA